MSHIILAFICAYGAGIAWVHRRWVLLACLLGAAALNAGVAWK